MNTFSRSATGQCATIQASVCAGGGPQALWLPCAGGDGAGEPGWDGDGAEPLGEEAAGGLASPPPLLPLFCLRLLLLRFQSSSSHLSPFPPSPSFSLPPPRPSIPSPSPLPLLPPSALSLLSSSLLFPPPTPPLFTPPLPPFLFAFSSSSSVLILKHLFFLLLPHPLTPPFPSFPIFFFTSVYLFILLFLHLLYVLLSFYSSSTQFFTSSNSLSPLPPPSSLSSSISFSPPSLLSLTPHPPLLPPHPNGLAVQQNEAMTGSHTQNRVFSRITLALMEDSGWYSADYRLAEKLDWGRGLGCDFVLKSCKFWMDRQQRR